MPIQELELRRDLKALTLGLASLSRTIARQRSRCRFLRDGDANTKFFNHQACHGRRTFSSEEAKSDVVFRYYDAILGTSFPRVHRLDLPRLELHDLDAEFTEEEVARIIRETPADRAPGRMGSTGLPGR